MSEIISSAPLLTGLREKGSTFYTFSSTLNDMAKVQSSGLRWAPSKFACIKLPVWSNLVGAQQMFRQSSDFGPTLTTDPNVLLPKMIQNYLENALQYSGAYKSGAPGKNYAEAAFWKMIKTLGALSLKVDHVETIDGTEYNVYVEDNTATTDYENIVKYVGDITMINAVTRGNRTYSEIYAYLPTEQGLIDKITWFTSGVKHILTEIPEDPGQDEVIGLETYVNDQTLAIYDTIDKKYSVGGAEDDLGLWFDDIENDITRYKKGDFDFNAVLLYYDVWSEANPSERVRNLYGILFLDKMSDAGSSKFQIDSYHKYQPDENKDGNAFGIKFNLIYSNASNQVVAQTAINDYDTISMSLYLEAIQNLNKITTLYDVQNQEIAAMKQIQLANQSKLNEFPTFDSVLQRLNAIERNQTLLNTTYRVTNEELFALFSKAVTEASSTSGDINIVMPVGNYIWDGDVATIVAPDGTVWEWDGDASTWTLQV